MAQTCGKDKFRKHLIGQPGVVESHAAKGDRKIAQPNGGIGLSCAGRFCDKITAQWCPYTSTCIGIKGESDAASYKTNSGLLQWAPFNICMQRNPHSLGVTRAMLN